MNDEREQRIRERAHQIWEREGRPEGEEQSHWDRASREIDEEDRSFERASDEQRSKGAPSSRAGVRDPRAEDSSDGKSRA